MAIQRKDLKVISLDDLNKERKEQLDKLEDLKRAGDEIKERNAYLGEIIAEWNERTGEKSSAGKRTHKTHTATVEQVTVFVRDTLGKTGGTEIGQAAVKKHFDALDTSCSAALDDAMKGNAAKGIKPTLKVRSAGRGKDGGNFLSLIDGGKASEKTGQEGAKDAGKAKGK